MKSYKSKLVGKVLKRIHSFECRWCILGVDPIPPERICRTCHDKFKHILQSTAWARHRRSFIATAEHSFCSHCFTSRQAFVPTTVVDHVLPWSMRPSLFWDETNHQGLCFGCHSAKTASDGSYVDGGLFGRHA